MVRMNPMNWRYCEGCKWEFDYAGCKNDYKSDMFKNKNGSLQCNYCMWYESKVKTK